MTEGPEMELQLESVVKRYICILQPSKACKLRRSSSATWYNAPSTLSTQDTSKVPIHRPNLQLAPAPIDMYVATWKPPALPQVFLRVPQLEW